MVVGGFRGSDLVRDMMTFEEVISCLSSGAHERPRWSKMARGLIEMTLIRN